MGLRGLLEANQKKTEEPDNFPKLKKIKINRTTKNIYPYKRLLFGFPYKRYNNELKKLSPESFSISKEQYVKFQFPDKIIFNNQFLTKPSQW